MQSFDKVVVSPHIEVTFKEGDKESVSVESITVPREKLNIEVKNNTLKIYLDGAKITADKKKQNKYNYRKSESIYKGTIVKAVVTYKNINALDLRGEEKFVFANTLDTEKLVLNIYGESQVYIKEVDLESLFVSIYGESYLDIQKGTIERQKFTAYGESKINASNVVSSETTLTAYGDGSFQLNVSKKLKITSYGEATITYAGSPELNKGIVIGESTITKVDF
ncbi:head GIN domain-containing protein [Aquimarina intermedia]|uniref:Putative autotransporter adhesin-like protein n=1 Tax=Aquimarina intermedia TaxID=350814 RepID=A0A5S5C6P5_9FLAO|nr:head GIN domain-containing protein [Aquimarina intermedia]TYP75101.1 putative autotransporter adhesin-like protein [Aquimarina intermedia]